MSLIDVIQEHRWWVLAISLPLIVIYGRVLVLAAFGAGAPPAKPLTVPVRRLPPKPAQPGGPGGIGKPGSMPTPPPEGRQEVLPNSLDAGLSGHQKAGSAKTVKLPATPSKATDSPMVGRKPTTDLPRKDGGKEGADTEADAMDGLFGKRDEPAGPSETPSVALRRKASRMEELGFHHGIANMPIEGKPGAPGSAATPVTAPVPASPAILPDGTPRSSTAELTSILERIDKFLAEDTPAKPVPTLPNVATTALVKSVSDAEAHAAHAKSASTEVMKPVEPAAPADATAKSHEKGTEAMPRSDDSGSKPAVKPDPTKKTQPMWARADAMDDDIDAPPKDEKKPGEGDQQRLF